MDIAIFLLTQVSWVIVKGIAAWMLKNEDSAVSEQAAGHTRCTEHPVRDSIQSIYFVGRIGEDDIEVQTAYFQEVEYIVPDYVHAAYTEGCGAALDKRSVERIHLHGVYLLYTSGGELIRDTACSGEEVKDPDSGEVVLIVQHVEQAFLRKIRSRTRLEPGRRHYLPSLERASDNSHEICLTEEKYLLSSSLSLSPSLP